LSDQDDIWQADKLSHSVRNILAKKVDAYSSNVIAFWPNGSQVLINKAQPQQRWDYMLESSGPGCTFVITKALAVVLQDFLVNNQVVCRPIVLHDWFIYALARSRGYRWLIDHEPHMFYRQHADNVVGANVGVEPKLARLKKLLEGWPVKQAILFAEILGYKNEWPIKKLIRYNYFDRLALIINVCKLRRRLLDRIALAFFLLLPLSK
jgi:rhamnosyltransferase